MINRQAVYDKYDGHCAYCGREITLKEMQVDHIQPARNGGNNRHENLHPSCKRCNHYKRGYCLEGFRRLMSTLHERIEKQYIDKVAIDYGIITLKPWDGKFYFETIKIGKS